MRIDVLSLFPDMFAPMRQSIIGKAIDKGALDFQVTDFRDFTENKHNNVDDYPFGGGACPRRPQMDNHIRFFGYFG